MPPLLGPCSLSTIAFHSFRVPSCFEASIFPLPEYFLVPRHRSAFEYVFSEAMRKVDSLSPGMYNPVGWSHILSFDPLVVRHGNSGGRSDDKPVPIWDRSDGEAVPIW